jgi:hypothetical protein
MSPPGVCGQDSDYVIEELVLRIVTPPLHGAEELLLGKSRLEPVQEQGVLGLHHDQVLHPDQGREFA